MSASTYQPPLHHEIQLREPIPLDSLPIPVDDWERIRAMVLQIRDRTTLWIGGGWALVGTGLPCLVSACHKLFWPTDSPQGTGAWAFLAFGAIFMVSGGLSILYGIGRRRLTSMRAQDVVEQMDSIFARYSVAGGRPETLRAIMEKRQQLIREALASRPPGNRALSSGDSSSHQR